MINRCENEEPTTTSASPESTLITIHRCQVCHKEQQQGNPTICLYCQHNEDIDREMQNNSIPVSQSIRSKLSYRHIV